jgi:hypothetical protein
MWTTLWMSFCEQKFHSVVCIMIYCHTSHLLSSWLVGPHWVRILVFIFLKAKYLDLLNHIWKHLDSTVFWRMISREEACVDKHVFVSPPFFLLVIGTQGLMWSASTLPLGHPHQPVLVNYFSTAGGSLILILE